MKVLFRLAIHGQIDGKSNTRWLNRKDEIPDGYPSKDFCFEFLHFNRGDFEIKDIRLHNLEAEPKGEMVINFKEWFKSESDTKHILDLLIANGWAYD